jgi:hypothetical protein
MFVNRKSVLVLLGLFVILALVAAGVYLLSLHVPDFYVRAMVPPGKDRQRRATKFANDFAQLYQDVTYNRQWLGQFDERDVNSFFQEQLESSGLADPILPKSMSDPRIQIERDRLRLGFRYRWGPLATIISIDMRVWLAAKELNVIALELQGLHAGSLPIAAQSLLEQVSETARQNNIEVTWYRYRGNPVALCRFQADQDRPTFRLDHIALEDHAVRVWGRSSEGPSLRQVVPTAAVKPKR